MIWGVAAWLCLSGAIPTSSASSDVALFKGERDFHLAEGQLSWDRIAVAPLTPAQRRPVLEAIAHFENAEVLGRSTLAACYLTDLHVRAWLLRDPTAIADVLPDDLDVERSRLAHSIHEPALVCRDRHSSAHVSPALLARVTAFLTVLDALNASVRIETTPTGGLIRRPPGPYVFDAIAPHVLAIPLGAADARARLEKIDIESIRRTLASEHSRAGLSPALRTILEANAVSDAAALRAAAARLIGRQIQSGRSPPQERHGLRMKVTHADCRAVELVVPLAAVHAGTLTSTMVRLPPRTGRVGITTEVSDARVTIRRRSPNLCGGPEVSADVAVPADLHLPLGAYSFVVEAPAHEPAVRDALIVEEHPFFWSPRLVEARGDVELTTNVAGAVMVLGSQHILTTAGAADRASARLAGLPVARHPLRLEAASYLPRSAHIDTAAGCASRLSIDLVPEPERLWRGALPAGASVILAGVTAVLANAAADAHERQQQALLAPMGLREARALGDQQVVYSVAAYVSLAASAGALGWAAIEWTSEDPPPPVSSPQLCFVPLFPEASCPAPRCEEEAARDPAGR